MAAATFRYELGPGNPEDKVLCNEILGLSPKTVRSPDRAQPRCLIAAEASFPIVMSFKGYLSFAF